MAESNLDAGAIANMYGAGIVTGMVEQNWNVSSASKAAQAAERAQQRAQDFSNESAQRQMNFQREMRSNAYQTAVADLKEAGLNPMLAYQQGGAPMAHGTAQTSSGYTPQKANVSSPVNIQAMQSAAQIANINAQTENIAADTDNKRASTPVIHGQVGLQNQQIALLRAQAEQTHAYEKLNDEQRRLVHENIHNAIKEGKRIDAQTGNIQVDTVLKQLDVPKARNEAEAQESWYMKHIAPYTGEVGKATSSAANLRGRNRTIIQRGR